MTTPPAEHPLLHTIEETSHLLSVSTWTVREMVRTGKLHPVYIGKKHYRITRDSIEKFARVKRR